MSDMNQEMIYFENMSRAFAMKAANVAAVMHRDINNPPMSTIWGRVELPVLQAAGKPWGTVDYVSLFQLYYALLAPSYKNKLSSCGSIY